MDEYLFARYLQGTILKYFFAYSAIYNHDFRNSKKNETDYIVLSYISSGWAYMKSTARTHTD